MEHGRGRWLRASITWTIAVGSWLTAALLCHAVGARDGPAVLAAVVGISLGRRSHVPGPRAALVAPLALAAVAMVAVGIGTLIRAEFALGALAFTAAMFGSVWLRNFGERGRQFGRFVALPLVGMLLVPGSPNAPGGPVVDLALVSAAGVIPLAYGAMLGWLARRWGLGEESTSVRETAPSTSRSTARPRSPSVATRMALQLAVGVATAFAIGHFLFGNHWSWAVLTAFIVCHGARGRGDAVYRGLLRLCGAAAGTLAAGALGFVSLRGTSEAIAIFVVLFGGLWLREISYAYWAGAMTLILACLAGGDQATPLGVLQTRLEAIAVGAMCGGAAAWFVLPIRTEAVIRRRLADALRALDDVLAHATDDDDTRLGGAHLDACLRELEAVAPPVRLHRRIVRGRAEHDHPARWVELTLLVCRRLQQLDESNRPNAQRRGVLRRAIGSARRAIAEHGNVDATGRPTIGAALDALHATASLPSDRYDAIASAARHAKASRARTNAAREI